MQELHKISAEQKVKKAEQKIVDQQFLGRRNEQLIKMMELIEVLLIPNLLAFFGHPSFLLTIFLFLIHVLSVLSPLFLLLERKKDVIRKRISNLTVNLNKAQNKLASKKDLEGRDLVLFV
jgi:hypothetical protein